MTFAELIEQVAHEQRVTAKDTRRLAMAFLDAVKRGVDRDGRIAVPGFGVFSVGSRKARTVRNPVTGEPMRLPAIRRPKFHASKNWRPK